MRDISFDSMLFCVLGTLAIYWDCPGLMGEGSREFVILACCITMSPFQYKQDSAGSDGYSFFTQSEN